MGLGFLERMLEIAESESGGGHGTRRDGATQDDETRGVSVEAGEGVDRLRGGVFAEA